MAVNLDNIDGDRVLSVSAEKESYIYQFIEHSRRYYIFYI